MLYLRILKTHTSYAGGTRQFSLVITSYNISDLCNVVLKNWQVCVK